MSMSTTNLKRPGILYHPTCHQYLFPYIKISSIIFRMNHNIKDDYSEEEDTDDNEDTDDEPEVDLGPGVKRIRDETDIDDMLDDTIFLVFSS
jgi:hypothetical protein